MAAKGPKDRRGRAKGSEPELEPTTSPEAPLPPENEVVPEAATYGPTDENPTFQEPEQPEPAYEAIEHVKPSEPDRSERPATWRVSQWALGGLALIVVAAALAGVMFYGTGGDPDRLDRHAQSLDAMTAQSEDQANRLGAAESALAGLQTEVGDVSSAVGQIQASLAELKSSADANRQNLDRVAQGIEELRSADVPPGGATAGEAVGEIKETLATVDRRLASLEQGDHLDELTATVARLQEEISELRRQSAARVEQAQSETSLGLAYAALTERIAAGAPFAAELEAVTAELPGAPGLEAMVPLAADGVPTVADLQARLAAIAAELPRAQPGEASSADGVLDTMRQRFANMVTVSRADEADWAPILARADEALRKGDIETAISEVEQMSDEAPGDVESWLAEARKRGAAEAGLIELSDAVLRQFAGRR